jgi:hypothetical protein
MKTTTELTKDEIVVLLEHLQQTTRGGVMFKNAASKVRIALRKALEGKG